MEPTFRLIEFSPERFAVVRRKGGGYFRIIVSRGDEITALDIEIDDWELISEAMDELMNEAYPERCSEKMVNVVTGEKFDLGGDE